MKEFRSSTLTDLRSEFKNPSSGFRPVALWFWNGRLCEDEIRRQMVEFKKGGLGGVLIHARSGYDVEYLSDRWWDMMAAAVEAARENDLAVWIWDEDGWPSGSAGGRVTDGAEERQAWKLTITSAVAGPPIPVEGQEGLREVMAVFRVKIRTTVSGEGTVSERLEEWDRVDPETVQIEGGHSDDRRLIVCTAAPEGYVDLLNPEVTRRFLEITHSQYEARLGAEFGGVIKGFFTDEPQIPQWPGCVEPAFPWTPNLPELFRERYGYDLIPLLPLLVYDAVDRAATVRVRCDFWQWVSERFAEGFYRPIYEYCESKGLLLTGHAIDEEDLFGHVRMQGDLMRNLQYMHISGVDHLFSRTDQSYLIEGPTWSSYRVVEGTIHVKHVSSAAHLHGREQCLVECFGGAGWDLTPSEIKRMLNWLAVLGINLFVPHGYYYSTEGRRAFDWPPAHFFQSTFWPYHPYLAEYAGRLSCLLTGGSHVAPVAVLYPIVSMWAHYTGPAERGGAAGRMDERYRDLCYGLLRLGFDYDVVTEEALQNASLVDGRIQIGDECYSVLVLPLMDVLSTETARAILRLLGGDGNGVGEGAKLLAVGQLPAMEPDGGTDEAHARLAELAIGGVAIESVRVLPSLDRAILSRALRSWIRPDVRVSGTWYGTDQGDTLCASRRAALSSAPEGLLPDGMYACHRRHAGGEVFFLANDTEDHFSGKAVLQAIGRAERWDFGVSSVERSGDRGDDRARGTGPLRSGDGCVWINRSRTGTGPATRDGRTSCGACRGSRPGRQCISACPAICA